MYVAGEATASLPTKHVHASGQDGANVNRRRTCCRKPTTRHLSAFRWPQNWRRRVTVRGFYSLGSQLLLLKSVGGVQGTSLADGCYKIQQTPVKFAKRSRALSSLSNARKKDEATSDRLLSFPLATPLSEDTRDEWKTSPHYAAARSIRMEGFNPLLTIFRTTPRVSA